MCILTALTGTDCVHDGSDPVTGTPISVDEATFMAQVEWSVNSDRCQTFKETGKHCSNSSRPTYPELTAGMNNPKYDLVLDTVRTDSDGEPRGWNGKCPRCRREGKAA
jgi:hypothetical protein